MSTPIDIPPSVRSSIRPPSAKTISCSHRSDTMRPPIYPTSAHATTMPRSDASSPVILSATSTDRIGYIYCSNNPINFIDPFGANKRDSLIATYEYEFAYKQENEIFNPQDPPDNNHSRNDGQTIPVAPNLTPSMVLMMMTPEGGAVSVALPGLAGLPTNLVPFQHYYASQSGGDDNDPNNNAAESSDNKVHGNSKQSKKQQHGYLIYDQENKCISEKQALAEEN